MSLIHWWPLDGDTQDKITSNVLTNTSAILAPSKIGQGYYFDGTDNCRLYTSYDEPLNAEEISFAFWVKLDSSWSNWGKIFMIGPSGTSLWPNVSVGVCVRTDGNIYFSVSDGSSHVGVNGPYHHLDLGIWYHITCTYNRGDLSLYVNGVPATGRATINTSIVPNFTQKNIISIGGEAGSFGECTICDVRIYDHALSALEAKELSKALIVHYTFDDILAETTTNLVTGITSGGRTTVDSSGKIVTTAGTDADTYFYLKLSKTLEAGKVYTISCIGESIGENTANTGKFFKFGLGGQSNVPQFVIQNGYSSLTFTATATQAVNSLLLDDTARCLTQSKFYNFQLEEKDHATPYTPDSRDGTIADESGHNHPATLYNNCKLTTDTNSGSLALHTTGNPDRNAHDNCSYLKSDIGSLVTPTEFTISFNAKVNQWGVQTSGILSLNADSPEPTGYLTSTFVQYDSNFRLNNSASTAQASIGYGIITVGEWHHYAFVWDGSILIGYRDGVQYGTPVAAAFTPDPFRYIYLGYDRAGGAGRDADVTWGDFRLYTTALDANEIFDLAKAKAYITDKSDIVCNKFIENCETALVTETSMFETMEIYENLLPEEYEQLEYIEFDYVQGSSEPYINTGYNTTGIYQIDCDIQVKAAANNYQFGQQQKSGWMYNGFYSTGSLEFNWAALTPRPTPATRHIMTQTLSDDETQIVITIDGVTWTTSPGTNGQGGDFYIFACRNGSNVFRHYGAGMRLYSFRIHEGYRTVREFIPAKRKSDSVIGLYDAATRELYVNAGTGSFIGGPVVKNDEALIYENGNISGREIIEI